MENKKRKREEEIPTIITFHAPTRTFDRVFKEQSLQETKDSVRKKLGLAPDVGFRLVQLRGNAQVDLEDDEDFEAFCALARSNSTLDVLINYGDSQQAFSPPVHSQAQIPAFPSAISISTSGRKKKKRKQLGDSVGISLHTPVTPTTGQVSRPNDGLVRTSEVSPVESEPPTIDSVHKENVVHARGRRNSATVSQSPEAVAGPSRIVDSPSTYAHRSSSPPRKKKKTDRTPTEGTSRGVEESRAKRRKQKSQDDAYADAEHTTLVLDLDSVSPEEHLPPVKKSKKRKLEDHRVPETAEASNPVPAEVPESTKKKGKRKAQVPTSNVDETLEASHSEPEAALPETSTDVEKPPRKKKRPSRQEKMVPLDSPSPALEDGLTSKPTQKPSKSKKKLKDTLATDDSSGDFTKVGRSTTDGERELEPVHVEKVSKKKGKKTRDEEAHEPSSVDSLDAEVLDVDADDAAAASKPRHKTRKSSRADVGEQTSASSAVEVAPEETAGAKHAKKKPTRNNVHITTPEAVLPSNTVESTAVLKPKKRTKSKRTVVDDSPRISPETSREQSLENPAAAGTTKKKGSRTKDTTKVSDNSLDRASSDKQAEAPATSQPEATNEEADLSPADKKGKRRKKAKTDTSSDPADPNTEINTQKGSKARSGKKPQVPKTTVSTDDDVFLAAVTAVRARNRQQTSSTSSQPLPSTSTPVIPHDPVVEPSQRPETDSSAQTRGVATKRRSAAKEKSKLSQSWVPTEEAVPDVAPISEDTHSNAAQSSGKDNKALEQNIPEEPVDEPPAQSTPSTPFEPRPHVRDMTPEIPLPSLSIPAGTEISEVVVEGKDEGSSTDNDSDSGSDSEDEDEPLAEPSEAAAPEVVDPFSAPSTQTDLNEASIEALLRGPTPKRTLLAVLASESSAEDSEPEEGSEPEELASDEEERNDRAFRRLSRRLERDISSSDEEMAVDVPNNDEAASPSDSEPPELEADTEIAGEPVSLKDDTPDDVDVDDSPVAADGDDEPGAMPSASKPQLDGAHPTAGEESLAVAPPLPTSPAGAIVQPGSLETDTSASSPATQAPGPEREQVHAPSAPEEEAASADLPNEAARDKPHATDAHGDSEMEAHVEDRVMSPPPVVPSRSSSQEDPQDPIDSADDLPKSPHPMDVDPIEGDHTEPVPPRFTTPPPSSVSRPGTAKRMKDRNGKVPPAHALPVLASEDAEATQQQLDIVASYVSPGPESEDEPPNMISAALDLTAVTKRKARSTASKPSAEASSASSEVKPRGRPKMTEEEKKKRAEERKAETARKRAEKQAEKARLAAEKKAEREAAKAEKARKAAEAKAAKAKVAKGKDEPSGVERTEESPEQTGSASSNSVLQVEGMLGTPAATGLNTPVVNAAESGSGEPPAQAQASALDAALQTSPDINGAHAGKPPLSQAKWTVLPPAPDATPDVADSSMYDELRSSSPEQAAEPKHVNGGAQSDDGEETGSDNQATPVANGNGAAKAARRASQIDAALTTPTPADKNMESPLFYPSSSQYPDSQPALQALVGETPAAHPASDSESEEGEEEEEGVSVFKKPMRPVHWGASARFRRLSDIASQHIFTPTPITSTPASQQSAQERRQSAYSVLGEDDSDSSSSSDEDADKSHIPKARRAGARPRNSIL